MTGILIFTIPCVTAVIIVYLLCCFENKTGLFEPFKYQKEIKELQKEVTRLSDEITEIKSKVR